MEPEGAVKSGFVNPVVNLGGGVDVVAVGKEGDLGCLESFLTHLKPSSTEGIDLAVVNVRVGDIECDEVDTGVT